MLDSSAIPQEERVLYSEFARQRGARLARIVGFAFGALSLLIAVGLSALRLFTAIIPPYLFTFLLAGMLIALVLFGVSVWLANRGNDFSAAVLIVGSILLIMLLFQLTHYATNGLDAEDIVLSSIGVVIIGLAGVLGNIRFMFGVTLLTNLLGALVCLILPWTAGASLHWAAWALLAVVQWTVALLYFGASTLYEQALHELGSMREAYEQAQKLDQLKDQFITNVNHELRNPIMALYNYVETVRLTGDDLPAEKRADMLGKAVEMGDRVVTLLSSILDVRRIDESIADFIPQAIVLRGAVVTASSLVVPVDGDKTVRPLQLVVPEDLHVWGDPVYLQEILTNLLSNATKYSAAGTTIEIQAARATAPGPDGKEPRQGVEVRVRDHGLGIPPDQIPLLFQRFMRLERDMASKITGNGLGLYLCRELVEAMGGRIRVESSGVAGAGSTFIFWLPTPP